MLKRLMQQVTVSDTVLDTGHTTENRADTPAPWSLRSRAKKNMVDKVNSI